MISYEKNKSEEDIITIFKKEFFRSHKFFSYDNLKVFYQANKILQTNKKIQSKARALSLTLAELEGLINLEILVFENYIRFADFLLGQLRLVIGRWDFKNPMLLRGNIPDQAFGELLKTFQGMYSSSYKDPFETSSLALPEDRVFESLDSDFGSKLLDLMNHLLTRSLGDTGTYIPVANNNEPSAIGKVTKGFFSFFGKSKNDPKKQVILCEDGPLVLKNLNFLDSAFENCYQILKTNLGISQSFIEEACPEDLSELDKTFLFKLRLHFRQTFKKRYSDIPTQIDIVKDRLVTEFQKEAAEMLKAQKTVQESLASAKNQFQGKKEANTQIIRLQQETFAAYIEKVGGVNLKKKFVAETETKIPGLASDSQGAFEVLYGDAFESLEFEI